MNNNDFNEKNENNDDRENPFQIVIFFRDHESLRASVCELFPIARINQDFLLVIKCKTLKF